MFSYCGVIPRKPDTQQTDVENIPYLQSSTASLPICGEFGGNNLSLPLPLPSACSQDSHFVFWVRASDSDPRLDTSSLVVKDQPQCFPVVTTSDTAVFKVGMTDCGTKIKVRLVIRMTHDLNIPEKVF